ncbi:hypothetical protein ACIOUE_39975 [Streptomyces xanthochromogenes]|uniref:hypothetical protein n=1 Tax=Streptomyces xanthochromogenes TaxID=67384 RepID=UPI00381CCE20
MEPIQITPRKLNAAERAVLQKILSTEFPGSVALLAQIDACEVVSQWDEQSVSVDIVPTASASPARDAANGPVPVTATVQGLPGDELPLEGEILIWVAGGYISGIEYAWYGDEMPTKLPEPQRIIID